MLEVGTPAQSKELSGAEKFISELSGRTNITSVGFDELIKEFEGQYLNPLAIKFADDSQILYNEDEFGWYVYEKVCTNCFGTKSIPVGGKSEKTVVC